MDKALMGYVERIRNTNRTRFAMLTPKQRQYMETGYKAGFEDGRNLGWVEGVTQGRTEPCSYLFD